jgi:uncharacterized tellurite resistance protein B-like protein
MLKTNRFYKELGNLFYAVAAADKKIRPEERKIIHEEVLHAWKLYDENLDRFGSGKAFLIEYEFETMEDEHESAKNALDSFEQYFMENEISIDTDTRQKIFESVRHIAESVRKINSIELSYLLRIKKLLKI